MVRNRPTERKIYADRDGCGDSNGKQNAAKLVGAAKPGHLVLAFNETPSRFAILRTVSGGRSIMRAIVSREFSRRSELYQAALFGEGPASLRHLDH